MDTLFAAYSRRFLISRLKHQLPYNISRSGARSLRVLWYMREMGGGWLSFRDLSLIGAGQYKALQYAIPDLLKDHLIEKVQTYSKTGKNKTRYKVNASGLKILTAAEKHIQEEYLKAVNRIEQFRAR